MKAHERISQLVEEKIKQCPQIIPFKSEAARIDLTIVCIVEYLEELRQEMSVNLLTPKKENIQFAIDRILCKEMGTNGYMNPEQEEILKRKLIKEGYEETEVYRAINHYQGI